ncbi:MAG: hypothetical protein LC624_08800 [Halobacteriales archaeon]|nr:hypothetical protein [Halobacteriales archaeon]
MRYAFALVVALAGLPLSVAALPSGLVLAGHATRTTFNTTDPPLLPCLAFDGETVGGSIELGYQGAAASWVFSGEASGGLCVSSHACVLAVSPGVCEAYPPFTYVSDWTLERSASGGYHFHALVWSNPALNYEIIDGTLVE